MLSARVMTDRRNRDCGRSALESLLDIDDFYPQMELTLISDNMSTLEPRAVCINAVGNKDCSEATSETVRINIDGYDNDSKKRDPDISESIANHIDPLIRRRKTTRLPSKPIATSKDPTNIIQCTYNSTNDILSG
ncbi:hypothetical protein T05_3686 [Trichinella murrelli]|uniref:Uncharacterized protein n=1 Tax=Trichinella murrelli TaxID=144512 RepID=A0A0V0U9P9_9BILA|nr:hypothetical protein T05_3686 [Trichinella murrelli]